MNSEIFNSTVSNAVRKQKRLREISQSRYAVTIIFWMTICTFIYEVINGWAYLSLASDAYFGALNQDLDAVYCTLRGTIEQFFEVSGITWNFTLALSLFRMIFFDQSNENIDYSIKFYHLFVWSTAFGATIVPLIDNQYGYVHNANGEYFQCWIVNGAYQLCFYAPLLFYLLFSCVAMIYTVISEYDICANARNNNNNNKTQYDHDGSLTRRLILFTLVFIISWTGQVIDRILSILHYSTPIGIVWWHDIGMASIGLTDALVWGTSPLWKVDLFREYSDIKDHGVSIDENHSQVELDAKSHQSLIRNSSITSPYNSLSDREKTPQ